MSTFHCIYIYIYTCEERKTLSLMEGLKIVKVDEGGVSWLVDNMVMKKKLERKSGLN